ncbi:YhfC family intramembrane metalloprotease [Calidifontibacillus oryziterrae]|uniref:YhfC family intramembrane metalloprotease n=1 Tax=Calidifontibacillus oryziterrae TaxID=1191699 RepID=UPI0002D71D06|nr:YhfC family intramembrane metalloprotease [Calidifontibacillus oryziterrae]
MVTQLQMAGMIAQILIAILVPVAIFIYLYRKKAFSWKVLGIGILIFIIFSQVLEKALHIAVLDPSGRSLKWTNSAVMFVAYGALAAGVFEEIGRYVGFKFLLKRNRQYRDGLSFGLGHGGIEGILIGVLSGVNALVIANLINTGMFESTIGATIPAEQAALIKDQFINTGFSMYLLGGIERISAIFAHIAFSLLVLLGVRENRFLYVLYAIGLHALMDVVPAMYQVGTIQNVWIAEFIIALFGVAAIVYILKVRNVFQN